MIECGGTFLGQYGRYFMKSVLKYVSWFGILTGILSIVSLVQAAFSVGIATPLALMLSFYRDMLQAVLGWADEPLSIFTEALGQTFGFDLSLDANWKALFVLMWLYFSSDARANWEHRRGFAIFSVLTGGAAALSASLFVGLAETNELSSVLLRGSIPILAILIWEILREVWSTIFVISTPSMNVVDKDRRVIFRDLATVYAAPLLIIGAFVVVSAALILPAVLLNDNLDAGLIMSGIFIVLMAFYWLCRGAYLAVFDRRPGETRKNRFYRSGSTKMGLAVLAAIMGALLFFLLNAGINLGAA